MNFKRTKNIVDSLDVGIYNSERIKDIRRMIYSRETSTQLNLTEQTIYNNLYMSKVKIKETFFINKYSGSIIKRNQDTYLSKPYEYKKDIIYNISGINYAYNGGIQDARLQLFMVLNSGGRHVYFTPTEFKKYLEPIEIILKHDKIPEN